MREIKHLNFDWKYVADFKDEYLDNGYDFSGFEDVSIPHSNVDLAYNNFNEKDYQIESCYKKSIFIPDDKKGKRIFLNFKAVMSYAKVYLNGELIMEHKGGYTPFRVDLSDKAVFGMDNIITVYVDSSEREEIPPFGFVIDYLTYGGIYREVFLEYTDNIIIENCFVKTRDVLSEEKKLEIDLYLENYTDKSHELKVYISLLKDNKSVLETFRNVDIDEVKSHKFTLSQRIKDVLLWQMDNPELYDLKLSLECDGQIIDEKIFRFGFRCVEYKHDGFYLNGEKVKLRGLNRHQSFPYVGYAMPKSAHYKDAEILKYELGVNTVRLSHYPQSDHFLDRCDEIGLLVFDEIPGWQHVGKKGEWWDIAKQHTQEMIKKDWNRPSIIIWGTRINESQDEDALYAETNAIAKALDDTRPTGGVRCIGGSNLIEDVYTYNDFLHDGKQPALDKRRNVSKQKAPYLVTEHNGHMFPTKKFDHVQRRVEQSLRHMRVLDAMYGDDEISGAIGWCMFDYNTHKEFGSGDKICYHGVMDMFRIEKYASSVYASQQDEKPVMTIAQSMDNGDLDRSIRGDVYVFTNCDYIKLYINDDFVKAFYPDKKTFANVPHAPIIIDDFLGELFYKNEDFNKKDAMIIKKLLLKAGKVGENLPLLDKLKIGYIFLKYKKTLKDGRDLYAKYLGGWGTASTEYKFEGYKSDECVISSTKSQVFNPSLHMCVDSEKLMNNETYDVTRVVVRLKDEYGDDLTYANDPIVIKTDDKLKVIGPNMLSLIGGSVGFWVKTTGKEGDSKIIVSSNRFADLSKSVTIEVEKV